MADLVISTLSERPDLGSDKWDSSAAWPEFMLKDPTADLYYNRYERLFPDLALVAEDPHHPGAVAARGLAIPFAFDGETLPPGGWDTVIRWGIQDHIDGTTPTHVSALEISIRPEYQGRGLARSMVEAMRAAAVRRGVNELVAPVRPNQKSLEPLTSMSDYVQRTRSDGLPEDAWLRTHVRAGGEIVGIAPYAMTIVAPLDDWREWTGLPFDKPAPTLVEGALVPVIVDLDRDLGIYVEPNVWVRHRLD